MTPPGLNGPNLPPSSDERNKSGEPSPSHDPLLADLHARVISAEFAPKVAALMFCENIVGAYSTYSAEELNNCREAYILRDHMRESRITGFSDLHDRFENAWRGIKEEIAERSAGSPQVAATAAAFFIGHLVSETGWCLLTRDILAEIKQIHTRIDASTMGPFRRDVDVLQSRIDYLAHDPGYTLESRESLIVAKRQEQIVAGRRALGEVVIAHEELRGQLGSLTDRAVSELARGFLSKFTVEPGFHEKMVASMSRGFQEPFEQMLEVYLKARHDEVVRHLVKRGVVEAGHRLTPLLPSET